MTDLYKDVRRIEGEHYLALQKDYLSYAKEYGVLTLRTLIIAHGGALVALMAFVGGALKDIHEPEAILSVSRAMGWFVGGLILATLASAVAYLNFTALFESGPSASQARDFLLTNQPAAWPSGPAKHLIAPTAYVAIVVALLSCAALGVGAVSTTRSFERIALALEKSAKLADSKRGGPLAETAPLKH